MKKIIVVSLCIALLLSLIVPVYAATMSPGEGYSLSVVGSTGDISGQQTKEVTVYYTVSGESYFIRIPGNIEFTKQGDSIETEVNVTQVTLSGDRYVDVKVNSTHGWQLLQHDKTDKVISGEPGISYTMEKYVNNAWTQISVEDDLDPISLIQVHGTSDQSAVKLKFTMVDNPPNTGNYKDTLTFVSEVFNPQATT